MTKIYKIEILVIDHDELGSEQINNLLENTRYTNNCISPTVLSSECRDIGEWEDSNPLNFSNKVIEETKRLFVPITKTAIGKVAASFMTSNGERMYVVETMDGMSHIVDPEQLSKGFIQ